MKNKFLAYSIFESKFRVLAVATICLLSVSLSGCVSSSGSNFSSPEKLLSALEKAEITCVDPYVAKNDNYGYVEVSCHDIYGETFEFNLFDSRSALLEYWCDEDYEEYPQSLLLGENWYMYLSSTGVDSLDIDQISKQLNGSVSPNIEFCKEFQAKTSS